MDIFIHPLIPYLLMVLGLFATPGPATLSTAASGASFGFRKSVPYMLGIITGIVLIFVLVALGLGVLLYRFPTLHVIFKWMGVVYIFYLAYKIAKAPAIVGDNTAPLSFIDGIPVTLLNPKAFFAVMATFSQFVDIDDFYVSLSKLVVWTIVLSIIIDFTWCLAGSWVGRFLSSSRISKFVNISFAALLIVSVIFTVFT